MLILVPRATTEKIIQKKKVKKAIRELKCYTRKYLFNVKKKRQYGGIVELKKDLRYIKTYNNMTDINLTLSVITLNVTD